MTELAVFPIVGAGEPVAIFRDRAEIAARLAALGGALERIEGSPEASELPDETLLVAAGSGLVGLRERLNALSADVVRAGPSLTPDGQAARKFTEEHVHDEPEVRAFVFGSGSFFFRVDKGAVARLKVVAGDVVVLPAQLPHWFDAGAAPSFVAIRLFGQTGGWRATPTGDGLAAAFAARVNHDTAGIAAFA